MHFDMILNWYAIDRVFSPTHHPQFIRDKFGSEYLDRDVVDQITSASGSVHRVTLHGSESDWIEPSDYLCNSQPHGCERVYDAFHLLQNESSVQVPILISQHTRYIWFLSVCLSILQMIMS